jgi:hypothetical protein
MTSNLACHHLLIVTQKRLKSNNELVHHHLLQAQLEKNTNNKFKKTMTSFGSLSSSTP